MPKIQTSSINTQTTAQKEKKLIFNPKKIEKRKQIAKITDKYKNILPQNLITIRRKTPNFMAGPGFDKHTLDSIKTKEHIYEIYFLKKLEPY